MTVADFVIEGNTTDATEVIRGSNKSLLCKIEERWNNNKSGYIKKHISAGLALFQKKKFRFTRVPLRSFRKGYQFGHIIFSRITRSVTYADFYALDKLIMTGAPKVWFK